MYRHVLMLRDYAFRFKSPATAYTMLNFEFEIMEISAISKLQSDSLRKLTHTVPCKVPRRSNGPEIPNNGTLKAGVLRYWRGSSSHLQGISNLIAQNNFRIFGFLSHPLFRTDTLVVR